MWYIMNPLSPDRAITMSSIYYIWIELIIARGGSHNLFNILCWHWNHYKISKILEFMVINYNYCDHGEILYSLPYSHISLYDRPQNYTILISVLRSSLWSFFLYFWTIEAMANKKKLYHESGQIKEANFRSIFRSHFHGTTFF